jgi:hypothetical protein
VTVYDFAKQQSVLVSQIMGGNPNLRASRNQRLQLSAALGPFTRHRLTASSSIESARTGNKIGVISEVTPALEAAFPERFIRDENGALTAIDRRPVNFADAQNLSLRSSFSLALVQRKHALQTWTFSLAHAWLLKDSTRFKADLPDTNRLAGDSGGISRHAFTFRTEWNRGAWKANADVAWRSPNRIRATNGIDSAGDLLVRPAFDMNLAASWQLRTQIHPAGADGVPRTITRMTLDVGIDNLLDTRRSASLASGGMASGYERDAIDPLGRTVSVKINYRF